MRPFLAALLLLPTLVFAQSIALTVNGATTTVSGNGSTTISTLALNASGCGNTVGGNWSATGITAACTTLQIWLSVNSVCGAAPSGTNSPPDVPVLTVQQADLTGTTPGGPFSFAFSSVPGFNTSVPVDGGVAGVACGSVVDFTNYLCAGVTLAATGSTCNGSIINAQVVNIRYDNIPPIPPIPSITPLDTKLGVSLAPGDPSDTLLYFTVQYAVDYPDGGVGPYLNSGCGQISTTNAKCTISTLVNGTNYFIVGYSVDEANNVSLASAPVVGQPVTTYGFYANYLDAGGQPGGCGSATGGGPSALAFTAALLVLGVARRRG